MTSTRLSWTWTTPFLLPLPLLLLLLPLPYPGPLSFSSALCSATVTGSRTTAMKTCGGFTNECKAVQSDSPSHSPPPAGLSSPSLIS